MQAVSSASAQRLAFTDAAAAGVGLGVMRETPTTPSDGASSTSDSGSPNVEVGEGSDGGTSTSVIVGSIIAGAILIVGCIGGVPSTHDRFALASVSVTFFLEAECITQVTSVLWVCACHTVRREALVATAVMCPLGMLICGMKISVATPSESKLKKRNSFTNKPRKPGHE